MAGEALAISIGAMITFLFLIMAVIRTIFTLKINKKLDQLRFSSVGNKDLESVIGKVPPIEQVNPKIELAKKMREGKERAKKLRELEAKKKALAEEEISLNAQ